MSRTVGMGRELTWKADGLTVYENKIIARFLPACFFPFPFSTRWLRTVSSDMAGIGRDGGLGTLGIELQRSNAQMLMDVILCADGGTDVLIQPSPLLTSLRHADFERSRDNVVDL